MAASCSTSIDCSMRSTVVVYSLSFIPLLRYALIFTLLCTSTLARPPAAAAGSAGTREYHLRGDHMKSAYDVVELEGRTLQSQAVANVHTEEDSDHERELTVYSLDDYCTRANYKHDPNPHRCP